MNGSIELVLLDLDGTLVDTAPDLAAAANRQRIDHGLAPLPLSELRPMASNGARGLIGRALGSAPGEAGYDDLRAQFLRYYESALCVESRLFDGMEETLAALEQSGRRWGIVTNKIARFTLPLVEQLGLAARAACVVCGDTTAFTKPHPAPLLHAMAECGTTTNGAAIYVGDDRRDIDAGRAAGLGTVVAAYGYLGHDREIRNWGGDHIIHAPRDLLAVVGLKDRDAA